jgi:hypothetical protein
MFTKLIKISALVALTFNVQAMETLADRAQIHSMNAELLLPDGGLLPIDVSFDCGSVYNNTAMIITSQAGAELLAVAYQAKWGPAAGKKVMDSWHTKVNQDDPRKPTFIFVTSPAQNTDDQGTNHGKQQTIDFALSNESGTTTTAAMPELLARCGTADHPSDK